jgi:tetratricopeptide (TPR) repeat protein
MRFHRRAPVAAFGALFFFVTLAPSFYPRLDYAAERWLYLPAVGFFLCGLVLLHQVLGSSRRTAAIVAGLAALYCIGTYQRSTLWADDLRLWQDTAAKSPGKERPWTWLGKIYIERGAYAQALQVLERAEKAVEPGSRQHAYLLNNVGLAHANLKEYEKAVAAYRRAIEYYRREPRFHAHLAVALMRLGRRDEAWKAFDAAFARTKAPPPELYRLRGQEYFQEGRYAESASDFERAVFLQPDDPVARKNLAAAEEMMRQQGLEPGAAR